MPIENHDYLPPFLPPRDDPKRYLAGLSAHRSTEAAGKRCHRCGATIEYAGCYKPGIPFVWRVYCWSPSEAGENPQGSYKTR